MKKLYACLGSGNCFKPWLAMTQLELDFELILIDVLKGEQKSNDYLKVNPLGVVPYFEELDGLGLGESNAMLWYLAEDTYLMPKRAADRAKALQWMFFEQSKLEPFISPARFFTTILPDQARAADIAGWQESARIGLESLNQHLSGRAFMLRCGYSIVDIAIFGYVHVLEEAGLSLTDYPNIAQWIDLVTKTDRFQPLINLGQQLDQAA